MGITNTLCFLIFVFACVTLSNAAVIELRDDNFNFVDRGQWLIKFYAPWCQHCKKLAPVWEEVASHFEKNNNNVKVGRVDCDAESAVCSKAEVEGYPTIKYYADGYQKSYVGGRKKHDYINFVHKMNKPATVELTKENAKNAFQQENPAFFYVAESPNHEARNRYVHVAKELLELVSPDFYEVKDKSLAEQLKDVPDQGIVVFREGDKVVYTGSNDMESLLAWAKDNRFPYVSKYSEATYETLSKSGKLLVLGVTDTINPEQEKFESDFKKAAKQRGQDKRYIFGSLDALHYDRYATSFGATPDVLPTVVVIDESTETHYINTTAKYSSPGKIDNFLREIEAGNVTWQTWSYSAFISKKFSKFGNFVSKTARENVLLFSGSSVLLVIGLIYVSCFTGGGGGVQRNKKD